MNTNFPFLLASAVGVALLACSCASDQPPMRAPVVVNAATVAPAASVTPVTPSATPAAPVIVAPVAPPVFHGGLAVVRVDSAETAGEDAKGENAVDGDPDTIWHTQWQDATPEHPHEIVIELATPGTIKGFSYLPRQGENDHGDIKSYEFFISNNGDDFGQPVAKGEFAGGKDLKTVSFAPHACRFIKLKALSEINGEAWTSAAEIGVVRE